MVAALLLAVNRPLLNHFTAGQVDHHGLECLLMLATLACLLRRRPLAAGLVAGGAMWISPETLLYAAIPVLWLGVEWLLGTEEAARTLEDYTGGLTIAVCTALVIERPPTQWLMVDYDRLSMAQVAVATVALACAGVLRQVSALARNGWARIGVAAALVVGGSALLLAFFPGLLEPPEAHVSALVREKFLSTVAAENPFIPTDPVTAYWFLLDMGPALLPLLWLPFALRRAAAAPDTALNTARWRLLLITLSVSFIYGVARMRGGSFLGMALVLPGAEALVAIGRRRLMLAVAASGWWWGTAVGFDHLILPKPMVWGIPRDCKFELVEPFLRGQTGTILTTLSEGPELAWRTGRPSVAGPYHTGGDSIADLYAVLESRGNDHGAREVLNRRGVAFVVACRYRSPGNFRRHPDWLISRLAMGQGPDWLTPVPLPDGLSDDYLIYRPTPVR
jgi:hypothetical protein